MNLFIAHFFQAFFKVPFLYRKRGRLSLAHQAIFAEAFRQGLVAQLPTQHAFPLAISVHPHRPFRKVAEAVERNMESGWSLSESLTRTGNWVSKEFLATLETGEERGGLEGLLEMLSKRWEEHPGRCLARALRRPEATTRFFAALAKLLAGGQFKSSMIEAAGNIAAGDRAFTKAIRDMQIDVNNGSPFCDCFSTYPRTFDPFVCGLLKGQEDRALVRQILAMLGNPS